MTRVVLSILLPLLLPTALFFLYAWYLERRARAAGTEPREIDVPWSWLAIAGCLLAVLSLLVNVFYSGTEKGTRYEPPRLEDGKIVPGRVLD
jgi:hypothetical protein